MSIRSAIAAMTLAGLLATGMARAEDAAPERVTPVPLPAAVVERTIQLLTSNGVVGLPSAPVTPAPTPADRLLVDAWRGNRPTLDVDLNRVVLTFKRSGEVADVTPAAADASSMAYLDQDGDTFEVSLSFDPERLTVVSNKPVNESFAGGIRLNLSRASRLLFFLPGAKETDIVILVPRAPSPDESSVFICPRTFAKAENGVRPPVLVDSTYALAGARFGGSAEARGGLLSGLNVGYGKASILLAPWMTERRGMVDETVAKDLNVSSRYDSKADVEAPALADGSFAAAMAPQVALQLPSGLKRVTRETGYIWAVPVTLPSFVAVHIDRNDFRVGAGSCVWVTRTSATESSFTKEPFRQAE